VPGAYGSAIFFSAITAQAIRIVADDAVDAHVDQASHVAALVDRPRQNLEPESVRLGEILGREIAPEHRPGCRSPRP
jgi:hypothetical protein